MVLPYDFTAGQLSKKHLNPQLSHCGMIEFHLDKVRAGTLSGGKQILILGLKSVTTPSARKMRKGTIRYLNGAVNFPQQIEPTEDISCTFQDYVNGGQREILHKWFDLVWNEKTGLSRLPKDLKADGHMVLWTPDGVTRAKYQLYGMWPMNAPKIPDIKYEGGDFIIIDVTFALDGYETEQIGKYRPTR